MRRTLTLAAAILLLGFATGAQAALSDNGINLNGIRWNGIKPNGIRWNGVAPNGQDAGNAVTLPALRGITPGAGATATAE